MNQINQINSMNPVSPLSGRQAQSREQLLHWIDMVSFACYDAMLYLDTHPACTEALSFYQTHLKMRRQALEEYARLYGPLTAEQTAACEDQWNWIRQPWPWEGGDC